VVLDEADEMLDMGFAEDLELILEEAPETRQTALFSATLPPRIASIAERHLKNPARILIPRDKGTKGSMPNVRQTAYIIPRGHKTAALGRVLDLESPTLALIFCRTRIEVDELADRLVGRGYRVEALHGGMSQTERDRVMKKARGAKVDLLVATDVAARGLDIDHITHVVNYNVPASPESYVHRIGRTGRAGREGVAITLAEPREHRLLRNIESMTKQKIDISTVPTPLDVKARRLDMTKGAIREMLLAGELEGFRVVVDTLAAEFDPMEVAAAAVRMAHEATAGDSAKEDDMHIPVIESFARPQGRFQSQDFGQQGGRGGKGGWKDSPRGAPSKKRGEWQDAPTPSGKKSGAWKDAPTPSGKKSGAWKDAPSAPSQKPEGWKEPGTNPGKKTAPWKKQVDGDGAKTGPWQQPSAGFDGGGRGRNQNSQDMVRIYIGAGTRMGIRPADLVGAIANEANINPRGIGDIEVADAFSIVELPEGDVEQVIKALRGATIRGRKVKVNRDLGIRKERGQF